MTETGETTQEKRKRLPKYGTPRVETYTHEGHGEDQERVKIVRSKTVLTGTLEGTGTQEMKLKEKLADFPAGNAYKVMNALADHFNCEVQER